MLHEGGILMGTSIHAVGSDGFRFTRQALPFDEVLAAGAALEIINAGPPRRVAGQAVRSATAPSSIPEMAGQIGTRHAFRNGVHAMLGETPAPLLFVSGRGSRTGNNLDWSNVGHMDDWSLTRAIIETLEPVGLNTMGVVAGIGESFTRFCARHPKRQRPPRLMVQITA